MEEHGHVLVRVELVEEEREVVKPDGFLVDLVQGFLREEEGGQLVGDERGKTRRLRLAAPRLITSGQACAPRFPFVVAHFDAGKGPSGDSGELGELVDAEAAFASVFLEESG